MLRETTAGKLSCETLYKKSNLIGFPKQPAFLNKSNYVKNTPTVDFSGCFDISDVTGRFLDSSDSVLKPKM